MTPDPTAPDPTAPGSAAADPAAGAHVRLRRLRWWDLDSVLPLERELFPDDPWSAGQWWGELARVPQTRQYLVAEDPDGVVGYAGLYALPPDADVQTIAVAPRARRTGVGDRLLAALVDEARHRGCRRLLLEVRADNGPAQRLYARHGFQTLARRPGYYGPGTDALVMVADLHPATPVARTVPDPVDAVAQEVPGA